MDRTRLHHEVAPWYLGWQHERAIVYHLRGDERTVPVGLSETRFSYGAIAEFEQRLEAKRAHAV